MRTIENTQRVFHVYTCGTIYYRTTIEADDRDEAIRLVMDGEGESEEIEVDGIEVTSVEEPNSPFSPSEQLVVGPNLNRLFIK